MRPACCQLAQKPCSAPAQVPKLPPDRPSLLPRTSENSTSAKFFLIRYEGSVLSPSSPEPLLFIQSSYFWPLGIVAPSRDLAAVNCSVVHPLASVRSASVRSASVRS